MQGCQPTGQCAEHCCARDGSRSRYVIMLKTICKGQRPSFLICCWICCWRKTSWRRLNDWPGNFMTHPGRSIYSAVGSVRGFSTRGRRAQLEATGRLHLAANWRRVDWRLPDVRMGEAKNREGLRQATGIFTATTGFSFTRREEDPRNTQWDI